MSQKVSSIGGHRRYGFPIFVDNVSKRIHQSSLREAFQTYGSVVDVFVAYKNQKRKNKATTFAFVRFRSQMEALGAIRLANGRRMDGHHIRVFRTRECSTNSDNFENNGYPMDVMMSKKDSIISGHRRDGVFRENETSANQAGIQRVAVHSDLRCWSIKDTRTFREALLGKKKPDLPDQVTVQTKMAQAADDANSDVMSVMVEEYPVVLAADSSRVKSKCITVPKLNMEWRKFCLKSTEDFPMQQQYDDVGEFHVSNETTGNTDYGHVTENRVLDRELALHDVPINCVGSTELGLSNGSSSDYGSVLGAKEIVADLVPKGIKLLKVPYQCRWRSHKFIPKKGRMTQVPVGCDRAQRAVSQMPGRAKVSKKFSRSKSCDSRLGSEMNGIVRNNATVPFSSFHSGQNKELEEEAVKVLEFSKLHGIEFNVPDELVVSRIVNLEKREGFGQ
ncbi:hypothetical protein V6N11_045677 [Hibiscus sabdariffa]|uniref:RRM domain-containing protein n=1 Tax=Hibiscus sabdariffa TaxID=183260 RepID=A0ABR2Q1N3_9ROSI